MFKHEQSEAIDQLIPAIIAVQKEIGSIAKNAENPFFHSNYTTLDKIMKELRPFLSQNNLALVQTMGLSESGDVGLTTSLIHISGQWIRGTLVVRPEKKTPQGDGSAITYARRYSISAMFGLTPDEDDDGEAGMDRTEVVVLSSDQLTEIERLLTETKSNIPEFLKWAGVKSVRDIPQSRFRAIQSTLTGKLDRQLNAS